MNKIKNEDILKNVMNKNVQDKLEEMGFSCCGAKSKIHSKEILIKMPLNRTNKGLVCRGKYLCVGFSNISCGRNCLYRAYAIEIEPTSYEKKFINSALCPVALQNFPKFPENIKEYITKLRKEGYIFIDENEGINEPEHVKSVN